MKFEQELLLYLIKNGMDENSSNLPERLVSQRVDDLEQIQSNIIQVLTTQIEQQEYPNYILSSNVVFDELINKINAYDRELMTVEDLRQICLIMHHMIKVNFEKQLWSTYLQSGTGMLKTENHSTNISFWPKQLKEFIRPFLPANINMDVIENEFYLSLIRIHLNHIDYQYEHNRNRLEQQHSCIPNFKSTIEPLLKLFVDTNLEYLRQDYQYQIDMITYDYQDEYLADKMKQQNVIDSLKQKFNQLCTRKYEQEKSKYQFELLDCFLVGKQLPKDIGVIHIPVPNYIEQIEDYTITRYITSQHEKIVENFKYEILYLFQKAAKASKIASQQVFDQDIALFWQYERLLPQHQRMTTSLLGLMEQRLSNQTLKARCAFDYAKMKHIFHVD